MKIGLPLVVCYSLHIFSHRNPWPLAILDILAVAHII